MNRQRSRSPKRKQKGKKQEDVKKYELDIYNLPEHFNKDDMVFYLWKALEKAKGLVKPGNPIIRSEYFSEHPRHLHLEVRSIQEAENCMELNGVYYGTKALYIKSNFVCKQNNERLNLSHLKLRKVKPIVQNSFNKIFVSNLPKMQEYEIIDFLSNYGDLKSFSMAGNSKNQSQCYCEFTDEQTQYCLLKLHNLHLLGRVITAKRATLMEPESTIIKKSKLTVQNQTIKPKSGFSNDLHSFYAIFDTVGYFKNIKISCVLKLKNVIPPTVETQIILHDIKRELSRIGPLIRITYKKLNIFVEYQKVQYAQIAYLLMVNKKYDNKALQVTFYDPILFADDILQ